MLIRKIINKDVEMKKLKIKAMSNHCSIRCRLGNTSNLLVPPKKMLVIVTAMKTRNISSVLEYLMIPVCIRIVTKTSIAIRLYNPTYHSDSEVNISLYSNLLAMRNEIRSAQVTISWSTIKISQREYAFSV